MKLFARYIGEDDMVALCLWHYAKRRIILTGDVVIQSLSKANNSVSHYE